MTQGLLAYCPKCNVELGQETETCARCSHNLKVQSTSVIELERQPGVEISECPSASSLVYLYADELIPKVTPGARAWAKAWSAWADAWDNWWAPALLAAVLFFVLDAVLDMGGLNDVLVFILILALLLGGRIGWGRRRLLGTPGSIRDGIKVLGWNSEVEKQPLATILFAVAFWNLRQQGLISLELSSRSSRVRRVRVVGTRLESTPPGGLEGMIMAHLPPQVPRDVSAVTMRWFNESMRDPWGAVVLAVVREMHTSDLTSNPTKLQEAFKDVAAKWRDFQTSEPTLYAALLDECGRGIAFRSLVRLDKGMGTAGGFGGIFGDFFSDSDDDFDFD